MGEPQEIFRGSLTTEDPQVTITDPNPVNIILNDDDSKTQSIMGDIKLIFPIITSEYDIASFFRFSPSPYTHMFNL